jgi:hypothetical protein
VMLLAWLASLALERRARAGDADASPIA